MNSGAVSAFSRTRTTIFVFSRLPPLELELFFASSSPPHAATARRVRAVSATATESRRRGRPDGINAPVHRGLWLVVPPCTPSAGAHPLDGWTDATPVQSVSLPLQTVEKSYGHAGPRVRSTVDRTPTDTVWAVSPNRRRVGPLLVPGRPTW